MGSNYNSYREFPPVMTVAHLEKFLHIGRSTAYALVRSGKIRTFRVEKQIRISREALIDYISEEEALSS